MNYAILKFSDVHASVGKLEGAPAMFLAIHKFSIVHASVLGSLVCAVTIECTIFPLSIVLVSI
jgi:hypothetical protein